MSKYSYGCCKHCGSYRELTKKGLCVLCMANSNVEVAETTEFTFEPDAPVDEDEEYYDQYGG